MLACMRAPGLWPILDAACALGTELWGLALCGYDCSAPT